MDMFKEINEGLDGRLNSYVNVVFLNATANSVVHFCFYYEKKTLLWNFLNTAL